MSREAAAVGWLLGADCSGGRAGRLHQSVQRRTLAVCSARKPRPRRRLRETEARPCRTAPIRWECDDPRGNAGRTGTFRKTSHLIRRTFAERPGKVGGLRRAFGP